MADYTVEIEAKILTSIDVEASSITEAIILAEEELHSCEYEVIDVTVLHVKE